MTSPVIATLLAGLSSDASGTSSISKESFEKAREMLAQLPEGNLPAQIDELVLFGYFLETQEEKVQAADQVIDLVKEASPNIGERVREAVANLGQERLDGAHADFARFQNSGGKPLESDVPKIRLSEMVKKPISG
jgi:hypothetical protein